MASLKDESESGSEQKMVCGKAEINMDRFKSKRGILPASARECDLSDQNI